MPVNPYSFRFSANDNPRYAEAFEALLQQELNAPENNGRVSRAITRVIKNLLDQVHGWPVESKAAYPAVDYDEVRLIVREEVRSMLESFGGEVSASILDRATDAAMQYEEVDEDLLQAILHDFSQA